MDRKEPPANDGDDVADSESFAVATPAEMVRRAVAIVGRPNVGKSALFNRLVGRRIAIVHEERGVTRDRIVREATFSGRRFELIDTGGIGDRPAPGVRADIAEGVRKQADIAMSEAAVVIFVVDIEAGVTPLDEEVAAILRKKGAHVLVAANKADTALRDGAASEFSRLGFPVYPVSALHDRGVDRLMAAALPLLPEGHNETVAAPLRVAIVGRPNVGKSSYINRLLRNERVIVSDVPGTTRDSIDIPFTIGKGPGVRHYILTDTAGLRRKTKRDTAVEVFSAMRTQDSIEGADIVVLVMDATQGITEQDKKIAASIVEQEKGCVLVLNKWDLMGEVTQRSLGPEISRTMAFMDYAPLVFLSATSGYNIRRTIEAIDHVAAQVVQRMSTGVLNRVIADAVAKYQAPMVHGKALKIYYATQVGVRPVRIELFVNDPKRVLPAYRSYLVKAFRRAFGLEGAPLVLHFRARRPDR